MPEYGTFDVPIKELLLSKKWKYGVARLWGKVFYENTLYKGARKYWSLDGNAVHI